MKKPILLLSLGWFALITMACKKQETVETPILNSNYISTNNAPVDIRETYIKEAKSKPLTTLALSEKDHDFGIIKKGETVEYTYVVTNTGTNPLIISNVKPGCGCTVPDFTKDPILPNKTGKITLKFDSSNFMGLINKEAEIFANVETVPIIVTFRGEVQVPK